MAALVMPMSVGVMGTAGASAVDPSPTHVDLRAYGVRLSQHKSAGPFHTPQWLDLLQRSYGFKPLVFETETGGIMPMMEAATFLTGRRGISLPFTDYCPALTTTDGDVEKLWTAAVEYGRCRGWKYVECRGERKVLPDAQPSVRFFGHELDLRPGEQALFSGVHSSVRRAIRKGESLGVVVQAIESEAGMRAYYRMHCWTRRKHGVPPQTWGFFSNIYHHLVSNGAATVLLAKHADRIIAGAVFLRHGARAVYKFGASYPAGLACRANNLVMWQAIKELVKSGAERLHFGRTSVNNEGLRRFKVGWGASEHLLDYYKYDLSVNRFVEDKDHSQGLHTRFFRMMPMPLLRASGTLLYRHTA